MMCMLCCGCLKDVSETCRGVFFLTDMDDTMTVIILKENLISSFSSPFFNFSIISIYIYEHFL